MTTVPRPLLICDSLIATHHLEVPELAAPASAKIIPVAHAPHSNLPQQRTTHTLLHPKERTGNCRPPRSHPKIGHTRKRTGHSKERTGNGRFQRKDRSTLNARSRCQATGTRKETEGQETKDRRGSERIRRATAPFSHRRKGRAMTRPHRRRKRAGKTPALRRAEGKDRQAARFAALSNWVLQTGGLLAVGTI